MAYICDLVSKITYVRVGSEPSTDWNGPCQVIYRAIYIKCHLTTCYGRCLSMCMPSFIHRASVPNLGWWLRGRRIVKFSWNVHVMWLSAPCGQSGAWCSALHLLKWTLWRNFEKISTRNVTLVKAHVLFVRTKFQGPGTLWSGVVIVRITSRHK